MSAKKSKHHHPPSTEELTSLDEEKRLERLRRQEARDRKLIEEEQNRLKRRVRYLRSISREKQSTLSGRSFIFDAIGVLALTACTIWLFASIYFDEVPVSSSSFNNSYSGTFDNVVIDRLGPEAISSSRGQREWHEVYPSNLTEPQVRNIFREMQRAEERAFAVDDYSDDYRNAIARKYGLSRKAIDQIAVIGLGKISNGIWPEQ